MVPFAATSDGSDMFRSDCRFADGAGRDRLLSEEGLALLWLRRWMGAAGGEGEAGAAGAGAPWELLREWRGVTGDVSVSSAGLVGRFHWVVRVTWLTKYVLKEEKIY